MRILVCLLLVTVPSPADWVVSYRLGESLLEQGRSDEAARHFKAALEQRPNDTAILDALGRAEFRAGRYRSAKNHFEQALQFAVDDAALYRIPADGGPEQMIEDGLALTCIAITRRALYLVRSDRALYALPLSGGPAKKIGMAPTLEGTGIRLWETRFTISPDDSTILWTLTESQEIDLEWFRP